MGESGVMVNGIQMTESLIKQLQTLESDNPNWESEIKLMMNNMSHQEFINRTMSIEEQFRLLERYRKNRSVEGPFVYVLIALYSLLILFGVFGNLMVVSAVVRKTAMRTVRNMFIINLAVSDLLLCIVTMPLTLMEILSMYWPFGEHVIVCKVVGCLQAVSIFVSTFSITAIALDRYHVIVYPTRSSVKRLGAAVSLIVIWLLACFLAAPLFIWKRLVHVQGQDLNFSMYGLTSINYCLEDWPIENGSIYFSIYSIIIQYSVPILVVSIAYARICIKLRYRMRPGGRQTDAVAEAGGIERTNRRDSSRVRRTNTLLISIALIFGICWIPLNMFNIIVHYDPFNSEGNNHGKELERIIFSLCHLVAMTSACSNPVLYGWLNENFRKEFRDIWTSFKVFFCRSKENNNGRPDGTDSVSMRVGVSIQQPTVQYKKSKGATTTVAEGEVEQSTLITQVLDRQK